MTAAESPATQGSGPQEPQTRAGAKPWTDAELRAKSYQVVAPYVTLKTLTPNGEQIIGFYAGASVPDDVPTWQIRHHLTTGQIVAVGEDESLTADEMEQRAIDTFREASSHVPPAGGMHQPDEPTGLPQHVAEDQRFRDLALTGQMPRIPPPSGDAPARGAGSRGPASGEATGKTAKGQAKQGGDPAAATTDPAMAGVMTSPQGQLSAPGQAERAGEDTAAADEGKSGGKSSGGKSSSSGSKSS